MDEFLATFRDDKSQLLDYFSNGSICQLFSTTQLVDDRINITHVSGCSIHIHMEDVEMFRQKLS